ncbi:MAG TPA: Lrp/AsnC family transcriptional regulator [Nitrososphaeraceae archaeon]|jgi:DNA-binding Lrp family transcriptional regulator
MVKRINKSKKNTSLKERGPRPKLDKFDLKIIELLISGKDNKYISARTKIPLSTVQRRSRLLFDKGLLNFRVELNYEKLGYKRGFLHVYLANGQVHKVGQELVSRNGILSVAVHIGNSDLVALFVYRDSKQLLDIISETKLIEGVDKVLWSEEVYFIPIKEGKSNISNI